MRRRNAPGVNRTSDADSLVERIYSLDRGVRYAAVFSDAGKKLAGGMREGVVSLEPTERANRVDRKTVQYFSYLVSLKDYLGETRCLILNFEKTDVAVLPFARRVVMVGTETGALARLLDGIMATLDETKTGAGA